MMASASEAMVEEIVAGGAEAADTESGVDEGEEEEVAAEEEGDEDEWVAGLYSKVGTSESGIPASRSHLMRPPLPYLALDRTPIISVPSAWLSPVFWAVPPHI